MPERVAGLLGLLRRSGDEALGEALREGLGRMLEERFGGEWPRRWMEEPAMLEHRMDEWEQEWFRQGREAGRAEVRALLARQLGADVEEPTMLEHRMDEWEQEWFRQGREAGLAEERALLRRQAARRFGTETAEALAGLLEGVDDADRLAEVGEMIVDCGTGSELLDRVRRT